MGRFLAVSLLALGSLAWPLAAQDLLPASFSGWVATSSVTKVSPQTLEQLAGAEAAILREYGTVEAERRTYARRTQLLTATVYRMRDPSAAYGVFTYLLNDQMAPANLTPYSAYSRQRALVVVGNLLLDVSGTDVRAFATDLRSLVAQLASHAEKTPYPTLRQHFPARGLVANSHRYMLGPLALKRLLPLGSGDWLGFADGAEAELARYRINGEEATLLLVAYPTPQAAARKLDELGRWLPLNPATGSAGEPASEQPPVHARRSSSLVALVAHARSRALADSLLQQVHYESQITWNEPGHRATDPSIGQILVGTIVGTGLILLFALVAGIGFGGVRLVVKYFFPGKVFDRAEQVEILQLGLSSKPIEAKDFY